MGVGLVAVVSDVHVPHYHRPTWRAFVAWLADQGKRYDSVKVRLLGDFLDLPSVSNHAPDVGQPIEILPAVLDAVTMVRDLDALADEVVWLSGNHEDRVYKKLIQPLAYQLRGLENALSLEAICRHHGLPASVRWIDESPPAIPLFVGQYALRHGHLQTGRFGGGVMPARAIMMKELDRDYSSLFGHFHRPSIYSWGNRTYAINPHMEDEVRYTGGIDGWCRGWSYFEVEGDRAQLYQVTGNTGRFLVGGRVYDGRVEEHQRPHEAPVVDRQGPRVHDPSVLAPAEVGAGRGDVVRGGSVAAPVRAVAVANQVHPCLRMHRYCEILIPDRHGRVYWRSLARWALEERPGDPHVRRRVSNRIRAWRVRTGLPVEEMRPDEIHEVLL